MSSPIAGRPRSSSDFLARWIPSSTRAGVILDPGSLRYDSPGTGMSSEPEDFAPMTASVDSSCLGVPGGDMEADRPEETSNGSQVSVMMKLDQLRRWQQNLQEQLKVDQLDQLLRLQEEQQQRALAVSGSSPEHNHSSQHRGLQKNHRQEGEARARLQSGQNGIERHNEEDPKHDDHLPKPSTNSHNSQNSERKDHHMPLDRPIQTGKQTFEELLEEQLKLEEQRLNCAQQPQNPEGQSAAPPKRTFLRRGEGLSRFTNKGSLPKKNSNKARKQSSQASVVAHGNCEKATVQRLPIQRKTATLNSENRPREERDRRVEMKETWTKLVECHQRQNTGGEVRRNKVAEDSRPATKQAGVQAESPDVPRESPETSSMEKHRWECERNLESMELGEFELLEQAAEEFSFSSNSSFVSKILEMDREKRKLLGVAGLHHRRLSSTPIKSPAAREQKRSPEINGGVVTSHDNDEMEVEDSSSKTNSDLKEPERAVTPSGSSGSNDFPAPSELPYDKRSYQDDNDDESEDTLSSIGNNDDDESDCSTLEDDKDAEAGQVIFDDDNTWNEMDDTAVGVEPVPTEPTHPVSQAATTLPPPPKLMMKLFPALKPKTQNALLPPPEVTSPSPPEKTDNKEGPQMQSTQLRERLVELEIEIGRFKKENAALAKLQQENERNRDNLRKERLAWEQQRAEQLAQFEEYKREESGKLLRERKLFEKHASAARAVPDKKEREEIQALKQQLSSLQEDLRKKESRWSATHHRLRQQIESLRQENDELKDEVRMLEKLRVSALKNSVDAAKNIKRAPPVSKGVTFADPLDCRSVSPSHGSTAAPPRGHPTEHAGMKSSLKKPAESTSSSSHKEMSEEKQMTAKEKFPNEQHSESSSPIVSESNEEERSENLSCESVQEVITHPDGKVEKVLASGDRIIVYPNGTTKEVSCDGVTVKVTFFNGDTKEVTADHRVLYYYANTKTTQVTYPDGMEVLHFPNNQTEKHFPDGRKEITFADQTVKILFPDGSEESVMIDGTVVQLKTDGTKEIHFNTGQKEVHTADYKRREYPDGTVKTVYADGRQETRYPGGRLRIKDKHGNVLTDERR